MAWVEFHATRIVKLKKFQDFRIALQLSKHEALGLLGSFWCEVLELREDGDITDWTPEYLAELLGLKLSPERVWKALEAGWLDTVNDRKIVHDWLDSASIFLTRKYSSSDEGKERLKYIWSLHGKTYGNEQQANGKRTVTVRTIPNPTRPYQPIKTKEVERFSPPCIEDIKKYCIERKNKVDADRFHAFYESKGWMVGKNKMKDWKAAVRTWEISYSNGESTSKTELKKPNPNCLECKGDIKHTIYAPGSGKLQPCWCRK